MKCFLIKTYFVEADLKVTEIRPFCILSDDKKRINQCSMHFLRRSMHQGVGIEKWDPILVFGFGNFKGFGAKNFIQCQDILQRSARGKQMDVQCVPFPTPLLSLDQFYDN